MRPRTLRTASHGARLVSRSRLLIASARHHCLRCVPSSRESVASSARRSPLDCSPTDIAYAPSAAIPSAQPRRLPRVPASTAAAPTSLNGELELDPANAIDIVRGDVLTGEGLERALEGIEVAYYLVHSMESPPPDSRFEHRFPARERLGATNFARAARHAGVRGSSTSAASCRRLHTGLRAPREP